MKLTEEDVRAFQAGYPKRVTEQNVGLAWGALVTEMECSKFAKRTGLPRDQVSIVVNARTKRAYPQWIHAIPRVLRVL